MKRVIFCSFFFVSLAIGGGVDSGSLFLYNDSPFILTAIIQGADGTFLGQISVQPAQQNDFVSNFPATGYEHGGHPDVSFTPYTVIWQCPSQEYYSMCTQVPAGAFVRATGCPGTHYCSPKPKGKGEKEPNSTLEKKK